MTTTGKLIETVQNMPEHVLAELLDFAEFLRGKMSDNQAQSNDKSLIDLKGGLENSATFAGDALVIQKRLRDEC